MQRTLLRTKDLTLSKSEKACRAAEATQKRLWAMKNATPLQSSEDGAKQTEHSASVLRIGNQQRRATGLIKFCRFCGRTHERNRCPAFGQVCKLCKKKNHFAVVCRNQFVRQLTAEEDGTPLMTMTVEVPGDTTVVNNVRPTCDPKGIFATLHVAGRPIRFQVDTSAACNVISRRNVELIGGTRTLRPTNRISRVYDGSTIKPAGTCVLTVENRKTKSKNALAFVVVEQAPIALIGVDACQQVL